ncbi:MAG: hypothetical protein U0804_24970 [Gemmataceae bacterium]
MFAFIPGLGAQEILLLGFLCFVPVVVAVVVLVVTQAGRNSGRRSVAELEDENRRLRDELRRAKGDDSTPPEPSR